MRVGPVAQIINFYIFASEHFELVRKIPDIFREISITIQTFFSHDNLFKLYIRLLPDNIHLILFYFKTIKCGVDFS